MRLFILNFTGAGFYGGFVLGGLGVFSMILLFLLLFIIIVITFAGDNFLASYSNGLYYIILEIFFFFVIWSRAGYQDEITLVVGQGVRSF